MPSINSWLDNPPDYTTYEMLVNRKTVSITVSRNGASLSAQTVRLETWISRTRPNDDTGQRAGLADGLVLGYKGHPDYTDTDLQFGDIFTVEGQTFEVVSVLPGLVGQFQAVLRLRE